MLSVERVVSPSARIGNKMYCRHYRLSPFSFHLLVQEAEQKSGGTKKRLA